MAGNKLGALKAKLGLRGDTKPGEMITRFNNIKKDMSGVNKLIVSNNQKNKAGLSALNTALVNATLPLNKKK